MRIGVLLLQRLVELGPEDLRVEQVLHPQARAQRLVGVGRADAAPGRAELVAPEPALGEEVELQVVRQDQVGVAAHLQPAAVDALGLQPVDLGQQHAGLDHDAVADDRRDVVVEHARRQELEGEATHRRRRWCDRRCGRPGSGPPSPSPWPGGR